MTDATVIVNAAGVTTGTYFARLFAFLIAISIFPTSWLSARLFSQWTTQQQPFNDLRVFARNEVATHGRSEHIHDLPTESLSLYAQAACVQAPTAAVARRGLRAQLSSLPERARSDLADRAVTAHVTATNTVQNTTAGAARDGTAFHYVAFWSTAYNGPRPIGGAPRYSTCVATAGVEIVIGEEVAEWRVTKARRQVATRPCECGFIFCEQCPIFDLEETRTPIFKRHRLTLGQQVHLHRWMVSKAAESANSLAATRESFLQGWLDKAKSNLVQSSSSVRPIDESSFLGRDDNEKSDTVHSETVKTEL